MTRRVAHLVCGSGRSARAACDDLRRERNTFPPPRLVETVGEVTCERCRRLLRRMYALAALAMLAPEGQDGLKDAEPIYASARAALDDLRGLHRGLVAERDAARDDARRTQETLDGVMVAEMRSATERDAALRSLARVIEVVEAGRSTLASIPNWPAIEAFRAAIAAYDSEEKP